MVEERGRVGSSFEDYLREQGTLEATAAAAVKRVIAWQLEEAMAAERLSKNQLAKRMNTSRSQLDRILDPNNDRIQLDTLIGAAEALGRRLRIELV
ncbi:helix-turn-helix domain-containing protein [Candidatus Palauibacter sp.]|uniref:helix-turn-helix domain-containing protein n=1 Tax=Candidatus Palauibacter sp. TaxID=3101350 RepID=UPI003AF25BB1